MGKKGTKQGRRGKTTHVDSKYYRMSRNKNPVKFHYGNKIRGIVSKTGIMGAVSG